VLLSSSNRLTIIQILTFEHVILALVGPTVLFLITSSPIVAVFYSRTGRLLTIPFDITLTYIQVRETRKMQDHNRLISNDSNGDPDDQGSSTWYVYRLPANGGIPVTAYTRNNRHPTVIVKSSKDEKMKSIPDKSNWYCSLPSAPYVTNCAPATADAVSSSIAAPPSISRKRKLGMDSDPAAGGIEKITAPRKSFCRRDNFEGGEENKDCDRPETNDEDPELSYSGTEDCIHSNANANEGDFSLCSFSSNEDDARWEENFQLLVAYKKKHNNTCVSYKCGSLGEWVIEQRHMKKKLSRYCVQRLNSIGFIWINARQALWSEMYDRLLIYKEQHNGSSNVPTRKSVHGSLGDWVVKQRTLYRRGELSIVRIAILESVGFQWKLQVFNLAWMKMYRRLEAYNQKYGNTRVPQKFKKDRQLGSWVDKQRRLCKDKDRVELLNKIGFTWNVNWQLMYQRLVAYTEEHGTTCVPQNYKADPKLADWVKKQRQICKQRGRIDLLNDIGFEWNLVHDNWIDMYQRLVAFKIRHGTTCVRKGNNKAEHRLANWVQRQRQFCKEDDRVKLLNKIDFVWNVQNEWRVMYESLVAYKKKHGTTIVPQQYEADPQLGNWVQNQRRTCEEEDRIDLLNEIGFVWIA
jgi:hypothetical protein